MVKHATGNTTLIGQAIIPFGSSDESIFLQDDMKDTPSNGSVRETVSFDSEKGMLLGAGGWMFDLSSFDFNSLEKSGQFSFTIEAIGLADYGILDSSNIGTKGLPSVNVNYLASWGATDLTTASPYGRIFTSSSKLIQAHLVTADTATTMLLTDHTLSTNMKITISWIGGLVSTYIDDMWYKDLACTTAADFMKFFHIGTNRGASGINIFEQAVYVKDFIISNRPVMTPTHPALAKIAFMGDSFANQSFQNPGIPSGGYQIVAVRSAEGYLRGKGVGANFTNHGVGGETIMTTGGADIVDQIAGVIEDNPQHVVCQGGTNDCNNTQGTVYNATDFETDYKSHITTILAGIKGKILVGNVITIKGLDEGATINAVKAANVASANVIIADLPAWWDAANPSDTGRIILYDLYAATGGENADDKMLAGLWWSGYDNYLNDAHLSSLGRATFGNLLGKTLFKTLF